jgi:hypothetical protein
MNKIKLLLIVSPFLLYSCSKGGDSTTTNPPNPPVVTESAIAFTVNVDPGAGVILPVLGTSQSMIVKVSSALPSSGVTVSVNVSKDSDNSIVFANSVSSTIADNNFTITGLTQGTLCTATVVVTSKSTGTNSKTITFKLAAK